MTIGERIKQRRIELGLTQTELAKRMGYTSRASICTVEKDKEDLTTTRIGKFAKALETTPAYLMGWMDADYYIESPEGDNLLVETINGKNDISKTMQYIEENYLDKIMMLNDDGLSRLNDTLDDLISIPKYQKGEMSSDIKKDA